jgi:hypothetical protein
MVFDSQGNLLVAEQGSAGVRLVTLINGDGTNVCVASSKQLIADASVCTFHLTYEVLTGPRGLKDKSSLSRCLQSASSFRPSTGVLPNLKVFR